MATPTTWKLSDLHTGASAPRKYEYFNGKKTQRWTYLTPAEYKTWKVKQKAVAGATTGTSAPTAGSAATGSQSAGAQTVTHPFNYDAYLASDPTLAAARTNVETGRTNLGTQLVGGVEQLYGRLGEMPPNLQQYFSNLPQEVRDRLAASQPDLQAAVSAGNQAGTSALAQLQRGYDVGQSSDVGSLVSRNMIHSGELGQRLNEDMRGLTLGQYNLRQQAADTLGTLQQSYLTGQSDLTDKASTALTDAQTRASNLIGLGQLGPYTTTQTNPYMPPTVAAPRQNPAQLSPANISYRPPAPVVPKPPRLAAPYASKPMP